MIVRYPSYYESFSCIADQCEDTCCAGWEIDIDDETFEYYKSVKGDFGRELLLHIKEYKDTEGIYEKQGFRLTKDDRCPFLDEHNLCRIYTELGAEALCDVCTDTPRDYLEYGGKRELSLSVSCPEAGRLLFAKADPIIFVEREEAGILQIEESQAEYKFAVKIREARDQAVHILQDRTMPVERRICQYLLYADQVQGCINQERIDDINKIDITSYDNCTTYVEGATLDTKTLLVSRLYSFGQLVSVRKDWDDTLDYITKRYILSDGGAMLYHKDRSGYDAYLREQGREYEEEHLMVYYAFSLLARCVDDYDFLGKAKLTVLCYLMIRDMDTACYGRQSGRYTKEDRVMLARLFAKEVEHSEDNLCSLADEILFEDTYTLENMMASLTIW